jgi:spermidine synthase
VIPWELLDAAAIPGGGALRLKRRGAEFSIMLGDNELMNSRLSGSEQALATLSCARLGDRPAPRVLIGGLGMGFTLRAALEVLGARAEITVAELVPAVVAWARGPMAALHGESLDDARVTVEVADVAALIKAARENWDAILLDVDNGPDGLTKSGNDGLYSRAGLLAARDALRPGGVLAVWSAHPDQAFALALRSAGFSVEEVKVRANGRKGARHIIWIATRTL